MTIVDEVTRVVHDAIKGNQTNISGFIDYIISISSPEGLKVAAPKLQTKAAEANNYFLSCRDAYQEFYRDKFNAAQFENGLWQQVMTKFKPYLATASVLLIAGLAAWGVSKLSGNQDA